MSEYFLYVLYKGNGMKAVSKAKQFFAGEF
jgi:hypothetical protein